MEVSGAISSQLNHFVKGLFDFVVFDSFVGTNKDPIISKLALKVDVVSV